MVAVFYNNVPNYILDRIRVVRDPVDNLWNALLVAETVNNHSDLYVDDPENGFNIAIYTGDFHRFLIKKNDGYFSMSIPFQVHYNSGRSISFHCDINQEPVDGRFISIMRNAIETVIGRQISHEDVLLSFYEHFSMTVSEAASFYDAFTTLLSVDHGYFRFDDDPDNERGNIHPRYHFDIFYKNSSSIKIGYTRNAEIECFLSLVDQNSPKKYLFDHQH